METKFEIEQNSTQYIYQVKVSKTLCTRCKDKTIGWKKRNENIVKGIGLDMESKKGI